MTRRHSPNDPRQASLFGEEPGGIAGFAEADQAWRRVMNRAIQQSGKSREQIAAEMERDGGSDPDYPVSKATLDAFTASSKTAWKFPIIYLKAFLRATGADWLLDDLIAGSGRLLVHADEALPVAIGAIDADIDHLKQMRQQKLRELRRRRALKYRSVGR